ncbi:hypothetical protein [Flavobacterium sp. HNIBRBA15423]|uniref:hypothetical protein n=1 Tax=Flavobacterium sp. HNIBRBA15423 TaxID=3458683 RepID=UPI004044BB0C
MGILIIGESKCPICDKTLNKKSEYLTIPPLTSNSKDPLFIFSDNGIHKNCLNKSLLKDKLLFHIKMYNKRFPMAELRCITDNQLISNPRNIISFGMLTSNENENLFKFNYVILNKDNIPNWNQKESFIQTSKKYILDKKWKSLNDFNYLEYLIEIIDLNR